MWPFGSMDNFLVALAAWLVATLLVWLAGRQFSRKNFAVRVFSAILQVVLMVFVVWLFQVFVVGRLA